MFVVSDGVTIEWVGDEAVVMIDHAPSAEVVRVSGPLAETLLAISRGDAVGADSTEVKQLLSLGLVSTPHQGLSRRGLLGVGATLGVAGVATMTLPSAASSLSAGVSPEATAGIPVPIPAAPNQANNEITVTSLAQTTSQDSKFSFVLPVARIQNWAVIEAWLNESQDRTLQVGNFGLSAIIRRGMEFVTVNGNVTAVKSVTDIQTDTDNLAVANALAVPGSSTLQLRLRDGTTDPTENGAFSANFNVSWPSSAG